MPPQLLTLVCTSVSRPCLALEPLELLLYDSQVGTSCLLEIGVLGCALLQAALQIKDLHTGGRACVQGADQTYMQLSTADCSVGHSQVKTARSAESCHSHLGTTIRGIQHIPGALKCPAKAPCFDLHEIQGIAACRPTAVLHLALKALRQ